MGTLTLNRRLVFTLLVFFSFSSSRASVVILKNGDIISGKLQETSATNYLLHSNFGTLDIQKVNIEKIIWNESTLKQVELTVQKEKTTGRLIRKTNKGSAYLLNDGSVVYKKKPVPPKTNPFFAGNIFLQPVLGIRSVPELYFNSKDLPAMGQESAVNTAGLAFGYIQPVHRLLELRLHGSYTSSGQSFSTVTDNRKIRTRSSSSRWAAAAGLRFYAFRFGPPSRFWDGLYTGIHGGYQLSSGEILVEGIEPYYFMDGRTVTGEAGSVYAGASVGLEFPVSDRVAFDLHIGWELDFYETLFADADRSSVTGPERELNITGSGPLATQLQAAAAQESINKDNMTEAFQSEVGYVQTWSVGLGVSLRFF